LHLLPPPAVAHLDPHPAVARVALVRRPQGAPAVAALLAPAVLAAELEVAVLLLGQKPPAAPALADDQLALRGPHIRLAGRLPPGQVLAVVEGGEAGRHGGLVVGPGGGQERGTGEECDAGQRGHRETPAGCEVRRTTS